MAGLQHLPSYDGPPLTGQSRSDPTLRVASVPAAHPYVAGLGSDGVRRLADPRPLGAPEGRWWPPVMLDAGWVAAHAASFDVMHLHFGTESFDPDRLRAWVDALRRAGKPLVFTVHDLAHPQLEDPDGNASQLDVLVPAADALITLTPGAAAEIERRWGRRARVLPHPSIVALDAPLPVGHPSAELVAGLHLRDLRPNVDGVAATRTLLGAVAALRSRGVAARARVVLHDHVRDAAARDAIRALCSDAELLEAPRPGDAALHAEVASLDVSVLPYRHGTHSGWAEMCWDLGVAVAADDRTFAREQHPDGVLAIRRDDAASLADAIASAGPARPGTAARHALQRARREGRRAQAREIAAAHLAIYRDAFQRA